MDEMPWRGKKKIQKIKVWVRAYNDDRNYARTTYIYLNNREYKAIPWIMAGETVENSLEVGSDIFHDEPNSLKAFVSTYDVWGPKSWVSVRMDIQINGKQVQTDLLSQVECNLDKPAELAFWVTEEARVEIIKKEVSTIKTGKYFGVAGEILRLQEAIYKPSSSIRDEEIISLFKIIFYLTIHENFMVIPEEKLEYLQTLSLYQHHELYASVIYALKEGGNKVRQCATYILGALKIPQAIEPLIAALKDSDQKVREIAVEALVKIGISDAVKPLIASLREVLSKPSSNIRDEETISLFKIIFNMTIHKKFIIIPHEKLEYLQTASKYQNEELYALVIRALKEGGDIVRRCATYILGALNIPQAVEPLIVALKDSDSKVRENAAEALGKMGIADAVEPLIALLRDPDHQIRLTVIAALDKVGDVRAVEPLIAQLSDKDASIRLEVVNLLGKNKDIRVIAPLITALRDEDEWVRHYAAEGLRKNEDERVISLIASLEETQGDLKLQIMDILTSLEDEIVLKFSMPLKNALIICLGDRNTKVHRKALEILEKYRIIGGEEKDIELNLEIRFQHFLDLIMEYYQIDYHICLEAYLYGNYLVDNLDFKYNEDNPTRAIIVSNLQKLKIGLSEIFKKVDRQIHRNSTLHYLYNLLCDYFREFDSDYELYHLNNIPQTQKDFNYSSTIENLLEMMKNSRDFTVISYIMDLINIFLAYWPELKLYYYKDDRYNCKWRQFVKKETQIKFQMADILAEQRESKEAIDLFYRTLLKYSEPNQHDPFSKDPPVILTFFEDSPFTQKIANRRWEIVVLTEYSHLKDLYQTNPFDFYDRWEIKNKLPLVLEVIHQITYPFNEHDKIWFEKFCQLVKPVCHSSLIIDGLFKYLDIAESLTLNGDTHHGYILYKWVCQEIREQMTSEFILPLRGIDNDYSHEGSIAHIAELELDHFHTHFNRRIIEFLTSFETIPSDILAIFIQRPYDFDRKYWRDILDLFKTIISKHPEYSEIYIQKLRFEIEKIGDDEDWQGLIGRYLMHLQPLLIKSDLSDIFSKLKLKGN